MQIILDGQSLTLDSGASYLDAVLLLYPDDPMRVLGVRLGGVTSPLTAIASEGARATSLTIETEEGRRIYERSLRFIFLLAMKELYPDARVRVENSTQSGLYVTIGNAKMDADAVRAIELRMRDLIRANLPYKRKVVSRAEAIRYFESTGADDKARLLAYRPFDHFSLYECGGMLEYFYGEMAPSTGYSTVFGLRFHLPGIELLLPDTADPTRPAKHTDSPLLTKTFAESSRWGEILALQNAADLNDMVETRRIREFIRVNEALHEKSISDIADAFVKSAAQLILVAGPSSSGKTTFAHRLCIQLRVNGLLPIKVSLDDYYLDRAALPLEADGKPDLERVDALDLPRLNRDIARLLMGETVEMPEFDFTTGKRSARTHTICLRPDQPVVIEGIHALNERLTESVPRDRKFHIYVSALTTLNLDDHNRIRTTDARLLRRLVRDLRFRATPAEDTLAMWDSVRSGERNYILPFQERADIMFNSTLLYELVVLKKYAYPILLDISPQSPYYTRAHRLTKFLNYIHCADVEDEIPPNSILREFIGGSCFYREDE